MGTVKKVTYSLPAELVADVQEAVERGDGASASAVVREAVAAYIVAAKQRQLAKAYGDAARDQDFMRDTEDVMAAFSSVDAEELASLEETE